MTPDQQRIAAILADARAEALEERPLALAAVNSITRRLVAMYTEYDPRFDAAAFRAAADFNGMTSDTARPGLLPGSDS